MFANNSLGVTHLRALIVPGAVCSDVRSHPPYTMWTMWTFFKLRLNVNHAPLDLLILLNFISIHVME